ncbi:MAG TPA: BTAD domain-containing putative transcriptional regulator, partial [Gaiellaceae bacterium]|nr:BTAD domain-containing putative transcriptional regulator [Gaiellaceae bacterium]
MEFLVLGPLQVVDDDHVLPVGTGRQTRLLAALLLAAGEVVSRDRLIDALWGESPPASAANALQVQVHSLRKLLGQERIATEGPGYRLQVEAGELDAERFERLVTRGRCELGSGNAEAAAAALHEALSLWRGPAFADVAYELFAQGEIARLEELRLVALEERLEADLALARHKELVPELESLVSAHPARERLYGLLMLALYREGRQTDALAVFRRARRTLREVGLDPGPELKELQQAVLRQDEALRIETPEIRARRHLPAATTPLVGRRRELDELGALLRAEGPRLVTLTGAGGIGKTRLALQIAHDLADAFEDGVFFVDLAPLREPELVPSAVADPLGVDEQPGRPLTLTLERHLRGKRLLLLLDNFEIVDEAAPLLGALLQAAPELKLLVTSRVPLRLSGEHEWRVSPLPLPAAVRLFAQRARAVAPGFRRPSEEAEEVSELCRRLDCLPLAIELAAARTRDYAPAELLRLFPRALELASDGARDLPGRHRRLRATIDWSYELLTPEERGLVARLAVFAGGCTAADAAAVCEASRSALASLVARSLLRERLGADAEPRYAMLETVREYALERLEESGEGELVRRRHAERYAALAEAAEQQPAADAGQRAWSSLEEEQDNLRAALDWSHDAGEVELELRLVAALAYFWVVRDRLTEGRGRIEAALRSGDGPPALRAKALFGAARLVNSLGDDARMRELAEESLAVYRSLGDPWGIARSLDALGIAVGNLGDVSRGIGLHEESAAIYRELGDDRGLAVSLNNLGSLLLRVGEAERAAGLFEEALGVFETLGQRDRIPVPLGNLGLAALLDGRPEEALDLLRQALSVAQELDYTEAEIYGIDGVAAALAATGEREAAALLLGAASAAAE